jgi:anti-sigma factor RsiW
MLSGYIDGELDLVHRIEVERHLQNCPECVRYVQNSRAVQSALRSDALYFNAPAALRVRVLAEVRGGRSTQNSFAHRLLRPAIVLTGLAALLIVLWGVYAQVQHANRVAAVAQQVACDHVRSVHADHLLDVRGSQPHVVKSWLSSKLDYVAPVVDLTHQGYPLLGGRLDYLNTRAVAAVVYGRKNTVVNLFMWPNADAYPSPIPLQSLHGYQICAWKSGNMTFCAVSDLSEPQLSQFAETFKTHLSPSDYADDCK